MTEEQAILFGQKLQRARDCAFLEEEAARQHDLSRRRGAAWSDKGRWLVEVAEILRGRAL